MTGISLITTKKSKELSVSEDSKNFVVFEKIDKSYDGEILVVKNLTEAR